MSSSERVKIAQLVVPAGKVRQSDGPRLRQSHAVGGARQAQNRFGDNWVNSREERRATPTAIRMNGNSARARARRSDRRRPPPG